MPNVADDNRRQAEMGKFYRQKRNHALPAACFVAAALLFYCEFPYSPKTQPPPASGPVKKNDSSGLGSGYLYPVNINQQACNPSISQSSCFPACMLWLGFDQVSVNVPDSLSGYSVTKVQEHDRLTIIDTANTVRWYMMISDFNSNGELQCPEWSTHPDYIACLTGIMAQPYSGYAVRISDKHTLKICNNTLEEFSTPHFWLPDSARPGGALAAPVYDANGFIEKDQVRQFFGTTQFKFIYTLFQNGGTLYYVDYSVSGDPEPVALQKPTGYESWYCHSPLISPDGQWVAYHCFSNSAQGAYYRCYIQRLSADAQAIFIADKASDPHWWVDRSGDDQYYIVYTVTDGPYFSEHDFSDQSIEKSGSAGATIIERLKGSWRDVPGFLGGALSPDESYTPYTLINLPFKGGLSRDGFFLCTAYKYAYLLRLK